MGFKKVLAYLIIIILGFSYEEDNYTEITQSLIQWGVKNKINFSNVNLGPSNVDIPNYYPATKISFTAARNMKKDEKILKIPTTLNISIPSILPLLTKKLKEAWELLKVSSNPLFQSSLLKELAFLSLCIERALEKEKGNFYKKYKPYLKSIEKLSFIHTFPLLFSERELSFFQFTIFGRDVLSNKKYIFDEENYIKNDLKINPISENYLKYRVLTESKTQYLDDTSTLVPFLDFFLHRPPSYSNAYFYIEDGFIVVKALKDINEKGIIVIETKEISNSMNFLYYGYTVDKSSVYGPSVLSIFHRAYIKKTQDIINWNRDKEYVDISKDDCIEKLKVHFRRLLGDDKPITEVVQSIVDNLIYSIWDYKSINLLDLERNLLFPPNIENLKKVFDDEQRLLTIRINYFDGKYDIKTDGYSLDSIKYINTDL